MHKHAFYVIFFSLFNSIFSFDVLYSFFVGTDDLSQIFDVGILT